MTNEKEMAISMIDQQKASLYGIAAVLVNHKVPNRKKMKRVVKSLRKQLVKSLGTESAKEIMGQNKSAIEMTFIGIRKFPNYSDQEKRTLIQLVIDDLLPSYLVGVEKVLGGKS